MQDLLTPIPMTKKNISIPLKESKFNNAVEQKTNQSAELVAAITGVHWFLGEMELDRIMLENERHQLDEEQKGCRNSHKQSEETKAKLVIATDSQYVVKGMTEWLPKWKVRFFFSTRILLGFSPDDSWAYANI